jgi:hypothetical protein
MPSTVAEWSMACHKCLRVLEHFGRGLESPVEA